MLRMGNMEQPKRERRVKTGGCELRERRIKKWAKLQKIG